MNYTTARQYFEKIYTPERSPSKLFRSRPNSAMLNGSAEVDGVGVRLPPSQSHPNLPALGAQVRNTHLLYYKLEAFR